MDRNRIGRFPLLLALVVLTLGALWPALQGGWVYDDALYVTGAPEIQTGVTLHGLAWAATSADGGIWDPLTRLSHMLDVELFGPGPKGPHAVNLGLHLGVVLLLFLLLDRGTDERWASFFVAALVAVHPYHVEPVAWVTSRKDLLSTLLALIAIGLYARAVRRERFPIGALVAFAAGLLAKPMLVTLPVLLVLVDLWPLGRSWGRRLLVEKIPFAIVAAMAAGVAWWAEKGAGAVGGLADVGFLRRFGNAAAAFGIYVGHTFWPRGFSVSTPMPRSLPIWLVVAGALALAAVVALVLGPWRRESPVVAGVIWFVVALLPVSGLVPLGGHLVADRFTYLPHVGLFVAVVWGVTRLAERLPKRALGVAGVAIVLVLAVLSRRQAAVWLDQESLFQHALAVDPDNQIAHVALGAAEAAAGRTDEAAMHFREAIRIAPEYAQAHNNLASALAEEGHGDEAVREYRRALALRPDDVDTLFNLGALLAGRGDVAGARRELEHAVAIDPRHFGALYDLAILAGQDGKREEAVAFYRRVLAVRPDSRESLNNLGAILLDLGRLDEAEKALRAALALDPSDSLARRNLGRVEALRSSSSAR